MKKYLKFPLPLLPSPARAIVRGVALWALLLGLMLAGNEATATVQVPDRILLKPTPAASETELQSAFLQHGAREIGRISAIDVRVLQVPAQRAEAVLRALQRNPHVAFAEPDALVQTLADPDDPYYGEQWHLPRIHAPAAWETTTGNAGIVIAILDTGVSPTHPDLASKLLRGYNFVAGNRDTADDHGHGTLVAGAAAAIGNNGVGVAGVAWDNRILPVKILNENGSGFVSNVAKGITYAADNGASIINMSLAGTFLSSTLSEAIEYAWAKNCILVAGAGNSGDNIPRYPAAHPLVISVSALNASNALPSWASFGETVELSAPGVNIWSTNYNEGYSAVSGSSFASPLVAGAAGLVLAVAPKLSNADVRDVLTLTADDLGPEGHDPYYGWGRVNAGDAVGLAIVLSSGGDTAPPENGGEKTDDESFLTVAILAPEKNAQVSGVIEVRVAANDPDGVARVELLIDGFLYAASDLSEPIFSLDTRLLDNGRYRLEARAVNLAGQEALSDPILIRVKNERVRASGGGNDKTQAANR
jgi:thermitase